MEQKRKMRHPHAGFNMITYLSEISEILMDPLKFWITTPIQRATVQGRGIAQNKCSGGSASSMGTLPERHKPMLKFGVSIE
ncbi:MAG: hypothetical protein M3436_06200 [Pseudomonadota bacterium]|nr:hypothetical protein [Pseudomonadota bacterium]